MRVSARFLAGTLLSALGPSLGCMGRQMDSGWPEDAPSDAGTNPTSGAGGAATATGGIHAGATGGTSASGGATTGGLAGVPAAAGEPGAAGSPNGSAFPCESAVSLAPAMPGFERCGEDWTRLLRVSAEQCPSSLPRASLPNPGEFDVCHSDAECTERPNGYCQYNCNYGCVVDSECGAGQICLCGDPVGRCVDASCTSDADCEDGFRCQGYEGFVSVMGVGNNVICGVLRFACQSPADSCGQNADCDGDAIFCNADQGHFECRASVGHCSSIGRPFLVHGAPRLATVQTRQDWAEATLALQLAAHSPELCAAAAEAWARVGLMEHASVAAFARFGLQLLSLGAPPELLELTTRAMADEIRHARLAFAIASQLGGCPIGPGGLDVTHALESVSLGDMVVLAFREGCVGETIGALSACEAAAHALDPTLVDVLERIADDETRHAELAWRFVAWALQQQPHLRHLVRAELERAQGAAPAVVARDESEDLPLLGILSSSLDREVRAAALAEVVWPCAKALLSATAAVRPSGQLTGILQS